jgi:hypothetical protein
MNELCVLVRHPDGSECFELLADYQSNPAPGSYIVHERPKIEPVKCEARGYQLAKPAEDPTRLREYMRTSPFFDRSRWTTDGSF